jgi:hypothetical protein
LGAIAWFDKSSKIYKDCSVAELGKRFRPREIPDIRKIVENVLYLAALVIWRHWSMRCLMDVLGFDVLGENIMNIAKRIINAFFLLVLCQILGFPKALWAEPIVDLGDRKIGGTRNLPPLQTRARPPLQAETLHLGMVEAQFFAYAKENNWAAIATIRGSRATAHKLQPGGEGLYALPNQDLVYARGFVADVYFEQGRLVGIRLTKDPRDRGLSAAELMTLVRAWFPDDAISVIYQVIPTDPNQAVIETLIGKIPDDFKQDLGRVSLPFCRAVVFPAPVPLNIWSSCSQNS